MANPFQIVQFGVSQVSAPAPSALQRTGCIVSQGGTTISTGTTALITQTSDLVAVTPTPIAISAISWSANVVSVTTATPHGITNGDVIAMTVAGVTPNGYNGTFNCTSTGTTTLTYPLLSNPGVETVLGTITPQDVQRVQAKINTYFANGSANAVYILELGIGTVAEGLTAFQTFMAANVNVFYAFLLPATWAASSSVATYLATFSGTTAKQYFHLTATTGNYSTFAGIKSVFLWVAAPNAPITESTPAADFYVTLNENPSSSNPLTPNQYNFLIGVTPWPIPGNSAILAQLKAASVNVVAPAAEGGLSNAMVYLGTYMDGHPFGYWYSVDWVQINGELNLANYIIEQTQNKLNPLVYNQQGIDRLQRNLMSTMSQAITDLMANGRLTQTQLPVAQFRQNFDNGLYAGQVVVNAEPFTVYTAENPNDYATGTYNGLSVAYAPQLGFVQILVNMTVTNFVSG